jgi:pimeloyl-ACP methyl ester carboxylesterase
MRPGLSRSAGGYHDFAETVDDVAETMYYRDIYRAGAALAYRLATGLDINDLSPIAVIDQIAPRPLLLIYGTGEPALPGARLQLERAGESAELLVIEGAIHGVYWQYAPEQFKWTVIAFLDAAFAPPT